MHKEKNSIMTKRVGGGKRRKKEMNDYEVLYVPSSGSPRSGSCCITISEGKVGFSYGVLEKLGFPKRIGVRRGVRTNEGKIIIAAATDDEPGSIYVDYDRKKICFYSKEMLDPLKDLIRKCVKGEFYPGIFYTVKGKVIAEKAMEFDFRDAMYKVVNVDNENMKHVRQGKRKDSARKESQKPSGKVIPTSFGTASGFNMPNLAGRMA